MHSIIHKAVKIHASKEDTRKHEDETLVGDLLDGEKRGVAIESSLANDIEKVWNRIKSDKQLAPENCPFLRVPTMLDKIVGTFSYVFFKVLKNCHNQELTCKTLSVR